MKNKRIFRYFLIGCMLVVFGACNSDKPNNPPPPPPPPEISPTGDTVFVYMHDDISNLKFWFSPTQSTVHQGDVLRFTQKGLAPHNVEFKEIPKGAEVDNVLGPFLTQLDETYDLYIDDKYVPGVYNFVCTPHQTFDMKGSFTVETPSP